MGRRRVFSVRQPFAVCRLLSALCRLPPRSAGYLPSVIRPLPFASAVCWLPAVCRLSSALCCPLSAVCCLPSAVRCLPSAVRRPQSAVCRGPRSAASLLLLLFFLFLPLPLRHLFLSASSSFTPSLPPPPSTSLHPILSAPPFSPPHKKKRIRPTGRTHISHHSAERIPYCLRAEWINWAGVASR